MSPNPDYKFRKFGVRGKPSYSVDVNGVDLGWIWATTESPYPGRSQAKYNVFPTKSDPYSLNLERSIGIANSRREAAEMMVAYLRRFKYGRKTLDRAGV